MRFLAPRRGVLAIAGSVLALFATTGAQAHAATVTFTPVTSMAHGGLCWTTISTWADTSSDWPGRAILHVRAAPAAGIDAGPYPFAPLCQVLTTVSWRNIDTGATGQYVNNVVAGSYGSLQYSLFQDTGPGRIEVTISTNAAHTPAGGSFVVPG